MHYDIKEPDKEISVDVYNQIIREVKREGYEPFKETVTIIKNTRRSKGFDEKTIK